MSNRNIWIRRIGAAIIAALPFPKEDCTSIEMYRNDVLNITGIDIFEFPDWLIEYLEQHLIKGQADSSEEILFGP